MIINFMINNFVSLFDNNKVLHNSYWFTRLDWRPFGLTFGILDVDAISKLLTNYTEKNVNNNLKWWCYGVLWECAEKEMKWIIVVLISDSIIYTIKLHSKHIFAKIILWLEYSSCSKPVIFNIVPLFFSNFFHCCTLLSSWSFSTKANRSVKCTHPNKMVMSIRGINTTAFQSNLMIFVNFLRILHSKIVKLKRWSNL